MRKLWGHFTCGPIKNKNTKKRSRVTAFLISSYHTRRVGPTLQKNLISIPSMFEKSGWDSWTTINIGKIKAT